MPYADLSASISTLLRQLEPRGVDLQIQTAAPNHFIRAIVR